VVVVNENPLDVCLFPALTGFWNEPECSNTLLSIFANVFKRVRRSDGVNGPITYGEFTAPWIRSRIRVFAEEQDEGVLLMFPGARVGGKTCASEGSGSDSEIKLPSAATLKRKKVLTQSA
jgi:hypothetical protein